MGMERGDGEKRCVCITFEVFGGLFLSAGDVRRARQAEGRAVRSAGGTERERGWLSCKSKPLLTSRPPAGKSASQ